MDARVREEVQTLRILIRPNRSWSGRGMALLFSAYIAVAVVIGTGFWLAGAYWVAPFGGLEAALLGAVLCVLYRGAGDYELILVDDERVRLLQRCGRRERRHEFQRYWVRVTLERSEGEWYPSRLMLGSHGVFVLVAAGVTDEERSEIAQRLKAALHRFA